MGRKKKKVGLIEYVWLIVFIIIFIWLWKRLFSGNWEILCEHAYFYECQQSIRDKCVLISLVLLENVLGFNATFEWLWILID